MISETQLPFALNQIETLPTIPAVALEMTCLIGKADYSIDALIQVIEKDPATSLRLMQLANSPLFHDGVYPTNLAGAASVLEPGIVYLASLNFALIDARPVDGPFGGMDLRQFWKRSLVRARVGRAIAERLESPLAGEVYLCGLLARLGTLILAQAMPEEYAALARESDGWPSVDSEAACLGMTCSEMTHRILEAANLPPLLCRGASFAFGDGELSDALDPQTVEVAQISRIAASVAAVLCDGADDRSRAALDTEAADRLGMSAADVDGLLRDLQPETERAELLKNVELPTVSRAGVLQKALRHAIEIGLGGILDLELARMCASGLEVENRDLESRARVDRLTGLPNRAAFDDFLERHVHGLQRGTFPGPLGLILLDLDFFKRINDTHGHLAGDEALRTLGRVLQGATRRADFTARYGGEEFVIVAPQVSSEGIEVLCERLRATIEKERFEFEGIDLEVTASLGAALITGVEDVDAVRRELLRTADESLYRAKSAGRNCWRVGSILSAGPVT